MNNAAHLECRQDQRRTLHPQRPRKVNEICSSLLLSDGCRQATPASIVSSLRRFRHSFLNISSENRPLTKHGIGFGLWKEAREGGRKQTGGKLFAYPRGRGGRGRARAERSSSAIRDNTGNRNRFAFPSSNRVVHTPPGLLSTHWNTKRGRSIIRLTHEKTLTDMPLHEIQF